MFRVYDYLLCACASVCEHLYLCSACYFSICIDHMKKFGEKIVYAHMLIRVACLGMFFGLSITTRSPLSWILQKMVGVLPTSLPELIQPLGGTKQTLDKQSFRSYIKLRNSGDKFSWKFKNLEINSTSVFWKISMCWFHIWCQKPENPARRRWNSGKIM